MDHNLAAALQLLDEGRSWVLLSDRLEPVRSGDGAVDAEALTPHELRFGLAAPAGAGGPVASFTWLPRSLPVSQLTLHAEAGPSARAALRAFSAAHVTARGGADDLSPGALLAALPRRHRRTPSTAAQRRQMRGVAEFSAEVRAARDAVWAGGDACPETWLVCAYDDEEEQRNVLQLVAAGPGGLNAFTGLGGVALHLPAGRAAYVYARVAFRGAQAKHVLVRFQPGGVDVVERARMSAHAQSVAKFFPHSVGLHAGDMAGMNIAAIEGALERASHAHALLVRVVPLSSTEGQQAIVPVTVPHGATVAQLCAALGEALGLPPASLRLSRPARDLPRWRPGARLLPLDDPEQPLAAADIAYGSLVFMRRAGEAEAAEPPLVAQVERRALLQRAQALERRLDQELAETAGVVADLLSSPAPSGAPVPPPLPPPVSPAKRFGVAAGVVIKAAMLARRMRSRSAERKTADEDEPPPAAAPELAHQPSVQQQARVTQLEATLRELSEEIGHLEIPSGDLELSTLNGDRLGWGMMCEVRKAWWRSGGGDAAPVPVAVKVYRYNRLTPKIVASWRGEVAMLRQLQHPNVVACIGACTDPELRLVLEYCQNKSLHSFIHTEQFRALEWRWVLRMALDAARGCAYLHRIGMIHRDVKSPNLLVDCDLRVKVADFDLSKLMPAESEFQTIAGTLGWMAPEIRPGATYTRSADVFSFGVVLWELVAGPDQDNVFLGVDPETYRARLLAGERNEMPDGVPQEYAALVERCWATDPAARPGFDEVVEVLESVSVGE